jgi:hypothetical protein
MVNDCIIVQAVVMTKEKYADEETMSAFSKQWTVEGAMRILAHPTVDSRLWAEAVEWLFLYGPPEMRALLREASGYAVSKEFPDLKVAGMTGDGEPVYSISALARALGITEKEAASRLARQELRHGISQLFGEEDITKIQ